VKIGNDLSTIGLIFPAAINGHTSVRTPATIDALSASERARQSTSRNRGAPDHQRSEIKVPHSTALVNQ